MLRSISALVALALLVPVARGDEFSGEFVDQDATGARLALELQDEGRYAGILSIEGVGVAFEGRADGDTLAGQIDDGFVLVDFRARISGSTLVLDMVQAGDSVENSETLYFVRNDAAPEEKALVSGTGNIIINGQTLDASQVGQLIETYGVEPLPGDYWYDAVSGLYGAVGFQAFGFMYPGHDFGPLQRDASRGDTGVYVNGRELPQMEWLIWSYMLGYPIQVGAYWLDGQGNAGYAGNPIPTVNLFVAAQQNAYAGQGGSGDNFWSTRFSAGNSNADNTQGYVSVPGYGPVGYGF